jgi:predicted HTH transcriptional regulator
MDSKREFSKDVAAFANAAGGYVLIGLATKPALVRAGEEVEKVRPFSRRLWDEDQHGKILLEWLYPQPKGLNIKWVQYGDDQEKSIGVIFVPPQSERSKPFLITRAIGDKKSTEVLVGYVERRLDTTEVRSVVRTPSGTSNGSQS